MSDQKARIREMYRTVYEQQDFAAVPEFYAEGAVRHGGFQGNLEGHDALKGYFEASLGGFSDIEVAEHRCVAEDDIVVFDFDMAATHTGEMLGIPPTENRIEITNTALFRVADGQIQDEWPRTDMLGLLQGLGVVELPF